MSTDRPQFTLVTGGTGFLGSHVVAQLLDAGYRVRCTARPFRAHLLAQAHVGREGQLEVVEVDDLASADLSEAFRDVHAVVHTAFPAPASLDPVDLIINGLECTTNVMRQAYAHSVRKFVLTSSYLAVVGPNPQNVWQERNFTEQDWGDATYKEALEGMRDDGWQYAAAKQLSETAAWDFVKSNPDMDLATVIPTLLIGPFAPGHPVLSAADLSTNVLLHSLITKGIPPHPVWPHFVDVRDAAEAHIAALKLPTSTSSASPVKPTPTTKLQDVNLNITDLPSPKLSDAIPRPTTPAPTQRALNFTDLPAIPTPLGATKKRFIVSSASFTWRDVVEHLSLSSPTMDECVPLPEHVASLSPSTRGLLEIKHRDWRETMDDAVRDIQRVATDLDKSGWFDEDSGSDASGDSDVLGASAAI